MQQFAKCIEISGPRLKCWCVARDSSEFIVVDEFSKLDVLLDACKLRWNLLGLGQDLLFRLGLIRSVVAGPKNENITFLECCTLCFCDIQYEI